MMNPTIASLTLRSLLGRKRALLLIPMPLILIGLTLIGAHFNSSGLVLVDPLVKGLGFAVIVPVVSLIIGSSVLGSEIDDGTIVHILTKPIPRSEIVLTKLAVAAGVAALVNAVTMFVCGAIALDTTFGFGAAVGAAVGSICYCALFLALSLISRRPVLLGLAYILLWEGLLGNVLAGTSNLSIEQFGLTLMIVVSGADQLSAPVHTSTAIVMSVVFLVGAVWLAINRLQSFAMRGETS
jgi:ABC-2 type transport system permease protein